MAAVLCGGISKLCQGGCECVGHICLLPSKICGACCEGLGQCCKESRRLVARCCSSRFSCHISVTCILNLPPIILGLSDLPNAIDGCAGSLWLLIFWLLSLVHIVAAFYMAYAVEKDDSILPQTGFQRTAVGGANRMWKLFCYDYWMAAYILIACGYVTWLVLGGAWYAMGSGNMDDDSGSCHEDIMQRVEIAYGFGWAFIFLGGCGLCCSMCCGVCVN
ncbi:expressed unknown protein [Seminavis robusta]|uniref:Uncharacterized protein n=1 Tax=Seminavis robusta TaxID=568900 RepID=A0A9N8H3V7_9STRA|nr:expressed unknown protein [Seminavis robusta]|eukprot:Sro34_g022130.1 n/a (219) ;mRNA; r:147542-148198